MSYAIISLGGKQYRVRAGERLLVDRVPEAEGQTFSPRVLLSGGDGDGDARLSPEDVTVTVRVVDHVLGEKIRIGKYKPKSGYRRHTGYRSRLSRIEVESIGAAKRRERAGKAKEPAAEPATAPAEATEAPQALPAGYADLTVAEVGEGAKSWDRPALEAALAYEQEHAKRKGAVSALESALAKQDEG